MVSTGLECFRQSWNTFVHSRNAFDSVGIPLYRVGMLYRGLEWFLQGWNAFDRVGIHLYRVQMLSRGLECFRHSWNTFVQSWNTYVQG
jgi:hypothetical protein